MKSYCGYLGPGEIQVQQESRFQEVVEGDPEEDDIHEVLQKRKRGVYNPVRQPELIIVSRRALDGLERLPGCTGSAHV